MSAPLRLFLVWTLMYKAGLRCGEMMALEWKDVDLTKGRLCVARSEWKGHVTAPKGVCVTCRSRRGSRRHCATLVTHGRHGVLFDHEGHPLTQKVVQGIMSAWPGAPRCRRGCTSSVPPAARTWPCRARRHGPFRSSRDTATWARPSATCI